MSKFEIVETNFTPDYSHQSIEIAFYEKDESQLKRLIEGVFKTGKIQQLYVSPSFRQRQLDNLLRDLKEGCWGFDFDREIPEPQRQTLMREGAQEINAQLQQIIDADPKQRILCVIYDGLTDGEALLERRRAAIASANRQEAA